ncbi:hypothetical protein NM208_g13909 [Fusarium decemcellulare]|uniref:Uncharacterized protein n=1 Tax=Fusarium decemcellulare TaxID=57161 RepID=A0ACC1RJI2_9HYPO|nr:hypothetical protein NM208_g13909 [Fusarium decemcellulare]
MIKLHALLYIIPHLPLTLRPAHAAILPHINVPFKLPGLVFTEPAARSVVEVVPFKETRHGHPGLHHTLSAVKRLVENRGYMVEVSEETIQELLDQINRLQEQVSGMIPSGTAEKQPPQQEGNQPGNQAGQLPEGSSALPSVGDQPDGLPTQPGKIGSSDSESEEAELAGPSATLPLTNGPGEFSLPRQTDAPNAAIPPQPSPNQSNASKLPGTLGQSDGQADAVVSGLSENSTQGPSGTPANPTIVGASIDSIETDNTQLEEPSGVNTAELPQESSPGQIDNGPSGQSDDQPHDKSADSRTGDQLKETSDGDGQPVRQSNGLPSSQLEELSTRLTYQIQRQTVATFSTTLNNQPTITFSNLPSIPTGTKLDGEGNTESSGLPGGAFKENPDRAPQATSSDTTTLGQSKDVTSEERQQPATTLEPDCPDEDVVSDLPIIRRNANCTPSSRSSVNDPAQGSLPAASSASINQPEPSTQTAPSFTATESPEQAVVQAGTSSTMISIENSSQAATIVSPTSVFETATAEPTIAETQSTQQTKKLRTLVFTSVLTRSSTVKATTTYTEFFHIGQPTWPASISGLVFKETIEETLGESGRVTSVNESEEKTRESTSFEGTYGNNTPTTTESSTTSTAPASIPESSSEPWLRFNTASANMTYYTTPTSGFRTMSKPTRSLAERGHLLW